MSWYVLWKKGDWCQSVPIPTYKLYDIIYPVNEIKKNSFKIPVTYIANGLQAVVILHDQSISIVVLCHLSSYATFIPKLC